MRSSRMPFASAQSWAADQTRRQMTTQMPPLEEPQHERTKFTHYPHRPLRQQTVEETREQADTSQADRSIRLQDEATQSLSSVNGREDVCRRYDVRLSAKGSVVRRLVESPSASVFDLARFLSDLDLVPEACSQ